MSRAARNRWFSAGRGGACAIVAVGACVSGCAKNRTTSAANPPTLVRVPSVTAPLEAEPGEALTWALVPGGASVVAVDAALHSAATGKGIRLEDGTVLALRPMVLRVEGQADAAAPTSVAARMGVWLGLPGSGQSPRWKAERAPKAGAAGMGAATAPKGGATILIVESISAPGSLAGTETTGMVGDRRLRVRWLHPAAASAGAPGAAGVFARVLGEEAGESVWMKGALAVAERSPLWRWRARLARGTLFSAPGAAAPDKFDDPVIEDLARTIEAQWVSALSGLAERDPLVARRVMERLCATVNFGGGVIVPAWMPDGTRLAELLDALLAPAGMSPTEAAGSWLAESSTILRWVEDDAASRDPIKSPGGIVNVANLTAQPIAAWSVPVAPASAPAPPDMIAAPPWTVRRIGASPFEAATGAAARPTALAVDEALKGTRAEIRAGEAVFAPTLYMSPVPALAPGVVIGQFHADWNLGAWLTAGQDDAFSKALGPWSGARPMEDEWGTSGLVYRGVDAPLEQGTALPDRWLLYMELHEPPASGEGGAGGSEAGSGVVRAWFGAMGRSRVVLRVLADGRVIDESPLAPESSAARDVPRVVRIAEGPNGWSCWIPIPQSAFEGEGVLRLGVERIDRRGVRTSWPRPSLPWQQEPSRITIDGSVWEQRK